MILIGSISRKIGLSDPLFRKRFKDDSDVGDIVMLMTIVGCFDETSLLATCKSVTNIIICQNVMLVTDL